MTSPARDLVANVLAGMGAAFGTPLALDDDGLLTMTFADDIACTVEVPEDADFAYLHAPVARVPPAGREETLAAALARNLFTLGVPGAALALDRESDELVLCCTLPVEGLAPDGLGDVVLAMVEEVRELRAVLAGPGGDIAPADEAETARPAEDVIIRG